MKRLVTLVLVGILLFSFSACNTVSEKNGSSNKKTTDTIESSLIGTWHETEDGYAGSGLFIWSFGEDGHFAYLFSAYEMPFGPSSETSSVRERFMQGSYRINGRTIEFYDVRMDDYLTWGINWRYFSDRNPEYLADKLLITPLEDSVRMDDFTVRYRLIDTTTLHLVIDLGDFPDQYERDFELVR